MNKFGIDKVILKNEQDIKYLESLADPKNIRTTAMSEQLCEDLDKRFTPKNPFPDPQTRKEKRKAKKFKKSYRGRTPTNVNWRRLKIAIPAFFIILLVGAIIGWVLMAGKNVKVQDNFVFTGWEAAETGPGKPIDDDRYFMSKLPSELERCQLSWVRIQPNAEFAETKLDYIKFKAMTSFNLSIGLNIYIENDASVDQYDALATTNAQPKASKILSYSQNKAKDITISLGNKSIGAGNSIWIEIGFVEVNAQMPAGTWFDFELFNFRARR